MVGEPLHPTTLVGCKATRCTPEASTIATAVAASWDEPASSAVKPWASTATPETPSSAAAPPAHARHVGPLRHDLDVAALEDALVKDEGLSDQAWFGELDVGIPVVVLVSRGRCSERRGDATTAGAGRLSVALTLWVVR